MKKLLGIVVLGLLWCNVVYAESSWFEIPNNDNTSNYWNLKKAEEIGPNKFKIPSVVIKTPERLKYEKFLIKKLVPYCGKAPGKYKEPSDFLTKGTPTTFKRALQYTPGVEETLWKEYKAGKSSKPAGMTLEEFQFEWYGNYIRRSEGKGTVMYEIPYEKFKGSFMVVCTTKIESYWKDDYSATKEKSVIAENIRWRSEEKVVPAYYDCRKRQIGIDLSGEPFWVPQPVKKNTLGEKYLTTICEKLN